MTSEVDFGKTNEFLRRRKLRLQQVREQSKDIAKKIRQRAKIEKLRQVVELDAQKQKEYFQRQEKLVNRLEEYYAKGIENVGASHKNAAEVKQQDNTKQLNLSKQRGKEAAAELRRIRQEKLDEHKKVLDRKLQAREAANEISREKSTSIANKLSSKPSSTVEDLQIKNGSSDTNNDKNKYNAEADKCNVTCNDMATQWDIDEVPHEWEPNIPSLSLPKDDNDIKETNNNIETKSDKSRKMDLFALSEEMPSSLRGGLNSNEEKVPVKPSLTVISEYLQNRGLRLRETERTGSSNKKCNDLQSLKQTIQRSRAVKEVSAKGSNADKMSKSSANGGTIQKKNSVTIYNHSTRDTRDIPYSDAKLVVRDLHTDDDAYSQAVNKSTADKNTEKEQKKVQEMRSKVAMTKQNVEKEYRDTITFLNSLPKDTGSRPIRTAYMDEHRQEMQREGRQRKLQHEYNKIQKECKRHTCKNASRSKSKTPTRESDRYDTDFQYSWMPVPEGDGNLAVHTIPTSLKEGKPGGSVKFSKVDSYHEYRSRHKHTPPTKEKPPEKQKKMDAVLIQDSSDTESIDSESSSTENIRLEKKTRTLKDPDVSDAERIIVYKILESKNDKKTKKELLREIVKSLKKVDKSNSDSEYNNAKKDIPKASSEPKNRVSFEHLNEGVYKAVNKNGDNIASMYFNDKEGNPIELTEDEINNGRPCHCGKQLPKDQQQDHGTSSSQWQSGDVPPALRKPTCTGCRCGCKSPKPKPVNQDVVSQPSAATSTSSFKTAVTDKAHGALPDGGYVKLIDESGQEAGQFYIGASGFLKDDAYEVVIQLRKKGDDKKDDKENVEDKSKPSTITEESSRETVKLDANPTCSDGSQIVVESESKEVPSQRANETEAKDQNIIVNVATDISNPLEQKEHLTEAVEEKPVKKVSEVKLVAEKGVCTSFQENFPTINDVPKSDSGPRPATSTYTQTSISSPNHRPPYFHMSSSTSTAYMSPPDMILPKYMRSEYQMTDEEMNDPNNYEGKHKLAVSQYSDVHDCRCRKCMKTRISSCNDTSDDHHIDNSRTPPNTVRSQSLNKQDVYYNNDNIKDRANSHLHKKSKNKCRKCKHKSRNDDCAKPSKSFIAPKHSKNVLTKCTSSAASTTRDRQVASKLSNSNLNPVIRDYVNKLLALNRESLKAVQVLDQDCSDVTTPSSSIINVKNNTNLKKPDVENKISLQQIKNVLKQQVLNEYRMTKNFVGNENYEYYCDTGSKRNSCKSVKINRTSRKKTVHKIKSLNISKHLIKQKKSVGTIQSRNMQTSSSSSTKDIQLKQSLPSCSSQSKVRSKSTPTPRTCENFEPEQQKQKSIAKVPSKTHNNKKCSQSSNTDNNERKEQERQKPSAIAKAPSKTHSNKKCSQSSNTNNNERKALIRSNESSQLPCNRATVTPTSESEFYVDATTAHNKHDILTNISTQTSVNVDTDLNFVKLAENKLQNMEKIADLTEKCTQRLSNLAKVLEEVRKNKSLAYSQISSSDSASDCDKMSDINVDKLTPNSHKPQIDIQTSLESKSPDFHTTLENNKVNSTLDSTDYVPFLSDIPKPATFKNLNSSQLSDSSSNSSKKSSTPPPGENIEHIKQRGKPPPALSRIQLKHGQDFIVPHELSTVVEVDSPMSMKLKSQASRNDTRLEMTENKSGQVIHDRLDDNDALSDINITNPDVLGIKADTYSFQNKIATVDSSDDSKIQMLDMKQFNEIMLKPFFSIHEYAKQYNIGALDDGSNLEDIVKDDVVNDELSSLHSDGSLPDVISELLKRNLISEPFKFDTGSNVNSTTVSSESTLSVLALSKARKDKKKSCVTFKNKENMETSDTLSISSNPDLENAFKKLGMGWASSTLKKTKERLALSSSSNTSSSSLSQFKIRSFNQDIPVLVTDTVSSVLNTTKSAQRKNVTDNSKHAEQQTSVTNTMTVKDFLTKELARKITFNNKSSYETEEEFMSLFETKMPEEMKHSSRMVREEHSIDNSMRSGNNRARTSTPVQLFKSMTYRSSSSSNVSNGLFSNADDLSSVKVTSNSMKHSTSDKDDLTIPNLCLKKNKVSSECSRSE